MKKIVSMLILVISIIACSSKNNSKNKFEQDNTSNKIETNEKMIEPVGSILNLPNTKDVLVLRTDFTSDSKWENICDLISKSGKDLGFKPYVEYLSKKKFEGLKKERLLKRNDNYIHLFIFIVDSITINHKEHPILCVDLYDKPGDSFRVIPSEMWAVENNLSISNMDFEEFLDATDKDGIHRGFK